MEGLLTAAEVTARLQQIYELVGAIRRQRSQNYKTYKRVLKIYVELESESVRANPTLRRTEAIETFRRAVNLFYKHLQKYDDMHRVVRIFKWSKMEDSRLEVVKEVDGLIEMLNLATAVAVMEGQAAAASNSRKLFAKLEDMDKNNRRSFDQLLKEFQDKQRAEVMEKQRGMTRQAPIPKNYGRALSCKKVSIRDEDLDETGDFEEMEVEPEPEGMTPVESENETEDFPIFSISTRRHETLPIITEVELVELNQQAAGKEEEEEEVVRDPSGVLNTEEVVEKKPKFEEEVVEEEKEPQEKEQPISREPVLQVEDVPVITQHDIDDVVENQQGVDLEVQLSAENQQQQEEEINPLVQVEEKETDLELDLVHNSVGEIVVEDQQEVDEEKIEPLALDVDEMEVVNPTLCHQLSFSRLLDDSSVPLLIKLLGSGDATTQETEKALLDLIGKCVANRNRVQVYKTKGISVLWNVVRTSESSLAQLYALNCLSWFTFSFSKVREEEFEELQTCVREPSHSELLSLLDELQHGDEQEKEVAVLRCSCLATRGDGETLRRIGALPLLIDLLTNGSANQKLWAAEALVTLASDSDENCVVITTKEGIPPLIALLRSGTDMQKQEAAYALGNLAANNDTARAKIAREGAIPPMVEFMKAEADSQNQGAISALGFLSLNNEENRALIAQEGAIPPLVSLLKTGTRAQKQWSAYTLGNLAHSDANRVEITKQGAIGPLIEFLRSGTAMQKQRAAFALGNLACDNDVGSEFDEAILPLVELVRVGSDTQKEDAAYTLGNLAVNNDGRRVEIGRKGAIAPLVKLLMSGNDDQKQWAAFALRCLACNNDENRVAIVEEGAIPPLEALVEGGTDKQKEEATHTLEYLAEEDRYAFSAETPPNQSLMGYLRAGVTLVHKFVTPNLGAQTKTMLAQTEIASAG